MPMTIARPAMDDFRFSSVNGGVDKLRDDPGGHGLVLPEKAAAAVEADHRAVEREHRRSGVPAERRAVVIEAVVERGRALAGRGTQHAEPVAEDRADEHRI